MEKTTHRGKKLEGPLAFGSEWLRPKFFRRDPTQALLKLEDQRQPAGDLKIPKAAGSFLEIGLQMKNRVAIFSVPVARYFREIANQVMTVPPDQARDRVLVEAREKPQLACEVAAIEKRNVEFQVGAMKLAAFGQCPRGAPHSESQIPERSSNSGDGFPVSRLGSAVYKKKEEVDVGVREKFPSPVPPEGHQA